MNDLGHYIDSYFIPLIILVIAICFVLAFKFIASRYKKFPPNVAGIFYGRKYKIKFGDKVEERGFMVVTGGGRVLMPLVESCKEMSTAAFQRARSWRRAMPRSRSSSAISSRGTCVRS